MAQAGSRARDRLGHHLELRGPQPSPELLPGQRPAWALAPHETSFHPLLPHACRLDPSSVELAGLHGMDNRLDHRGVTLDRIAAHEHRVAPRVEGPHGRLLDREGRCDGAHVQIIGHDEPLMPELSSQDLVDHCPGEGCRLLVVQRRVQHVRGHHRGDIRRDGGAKRGHFMLAQPLGWMLDDRKLLVRIDLGLAMPGKMLRARRDAVVLEALDDNPTEAASLLRVGRQRPVPDDMVDRVGRCALQVHHRGKIEGHPNRRQLVRQPGREPLRQPRLATTAEGRHRRPLGEGRTQPRDPPSLLVDGHPQRYAASKVLTFERELGHLLRRLDVSTEQDDAAQIPLSRKRPQLRRHGVSTEPGNHQLSDVTMKQVHRGPGQETAVRCNARPEPDTANYNAPVVVRSSAPTRIDLAGGTLDIWPLYLFHPGAQTVNVAIQLPATCTVTASDDGHVWLVSEDTGHTLTGATWRDLDIDGDNRLLAHIARFFQVEGVRVTTRAASPMGAGIGGSSALNIAVCAALARWQAVEYSADQLLTLALNLEAQTLGIPTGAQDYRPALYGGVSAVELDASGVTRVALEVDPAELEHRLVLAHSGDSRASGINNWDITRRHIEGDVTLADQFERIRDIATATREALVSGDWMQLARQVTLEWQARQALASGVTTPAIERLMTRAAAAGALAGKVCGAGGGGCVFFLIDPSRRAEVCRAVLDTGARLLDCRIDTHGLRLECREE